MCSRANSRLRHSQTDIFHKRKLRPPEAAAADKIQKIGRCNQAAGTLNAMRLFKAL